MFGRWWCVRSEDSLKEDGVWHTEGVEGVTPACTPQSDSVQQKSCTIARVSIKRLHSPFCPRILNTQIDILIRIRGKPLTRDSFQEMLLYLRQRKEEVTGWDGGVKIVLFLINRFYFFKAV